ncbi:MAG: hypothetical protein WCY23_03940 [Candidatus Omnitrophota bacterium]
MKIMITILLMLSCSLAVAETPGVIHKAGECKLQVASAFDDDKMFEVSLKTDQMDIICKFYGGEFFDKFMVFANPRITNKAGKKINVSYHVAFFDKAGELVCSASQQSDIAGNEKDFQLGSCLMKLPQEDLSNIVSYKIVVYAGEPSEK